MTKEKLVLPGDKISTSEELLPGDGTYEEDGIIRASRAGKYIIDNKNRKAIVKPVTNIPVEVKKGDTVLGIVNSVKSNMVIVQIIHVIGKYRAISGDTNGTLRVSEISAGYVKDPSTEFTSGDIIRAKAFQIKPSLQLTTKDKNLGVIKALCTKCKTPLSRKGNNLECNNCKNRERRTIAMDFGEYDIKNL
jgi:exosome complex component CSL4